MPLETPMRRSRGLQALFLAMTLLVICALVLLFYAYRQEKARTLHAIQVTFDERLDALDRCLFLARENVARMQDWARSFWQDTSGYSEPPALRELLRYYSDGDYFEIQQAAVEKLRDPLGNVFGPGRPSGRSRRFMRELNLVAGLMPLLRVSVSDSGIISRCYFFSVGNVSAIYPYLPVNILCGADSTDRLLKKKAHVFFSSHRELYGHAARNGYWTGVYNGRGEDGPVVTFAMPVYADGRLLGLLGANVPVAFMQRFVAGFKGPGSRLILVGRNGKLLMDLAQKTPLPKLINAPLEKRLPFALRSVAEQIISAPRQLSVGGYHVLVRRLRSAPCSLIHILHDNSLRSYLS